MLYLTHSLHFCSENNFIKKKLNILKIFYFLKIVQSERNKKLLISLYYYSTIYGIKIKAF